MDRINVRSDTNISNAFQGKGAGHRSTPGVKREKAGLTLHVSHEQSCCSTGQKGSVAVMGESFVGFGHFVRLFAFANSASGFVGSIHQFASKLLRHAAAVASARKAHEPTQGHRRTALLTNFHWHLVGGATNTER